MTKLLIVDDEQIEREGLQAILQAGFPDLIIEQAKNGRLAVQAAEEFRPDLILMDIMMPGMNGLEAIEIIGGRDPGVKFIMVTAYDTFDYARRAIKLGVIDYLLKPSKASEIVATVAKAFRRIEEERASEEASRFDRDALRRVLPVVETDVVTQLLFDHVHEVHLGELVGLIGGSASAAGETFALNVLLPSGSESLYGAIKAKIRSFGSGWVGALYGGQVPIIAFRDAGKSFRTQAMTIARELLGIAKPGAEDGWFVGIGSVCGRLEQIRQSYQEALVASMDPSLPVKYRFYDDTPVLGVTKDGYSARQLEKQFYDRIRLGQWEQMDADAMAFIRRYENEGADLLQAQQRVLELLWIASRALFELGVELDTPVFSFRPQDYRQLRSETRLLLERMRKLFEEHPGQLRPDTIRQIQQFIARHSREDVSLELIGQTFGSSPFYISKLFKEQLGVNYIDFLTEVRIENAKKLMGDPDRSLKEITYEVGYHDPNYFSKVFKKLAGVSPTEFRRTLLGQRG
ncbi:response regulator [Cohnella fermenti]|uniref:Response regulator n=1 Tax=Cohnella fermenti TaxID=2565925 RepID=A0A4S4BH22_9BACL|nr:response regulator [Cohnella fermenti]THF73682.1 response regulator [Cohnella fermenti]